MRIWELRLQPGDKVREIGDPPCEVSTIDCVHKRTGEVFGRFLGRAGPFPLSKTKCWEIVSRADLGPPPDPEDTLAEMIKSFLINHAIGSDAFYAEVQKLADEWVEFSPPNVDFSLEVLRRWRCGDI